MAGRKDIAKVETLGFLKVGGWGNLSVVDWVEYSVTMKVGRVAGWKEIAKVEMMAALKVGDWGDSAAGGWAGRLVDETVGWMGDPPVAGTVLI